jgi:serine/threonine protein kinase
MGTVFAVRDEKLNVACALKVVSALELSLQATRLVREARALLLISSAHVVRVFDVDEIGGVPYLVLERLEGKDLRELASDGRPFAPGVVADWPGRCAMPSPRPTRSG